MNDGETPLFAASQKSHLKVVKWLAVEGKAGVNKAPNDGVTPIVYANYVGHEEIVKYFKGKEGGKLEELLGVIDRGGWHEVREVKIEGMRREGLRPSKACGAKD